MKRHWHLVAYDVRDDQRLRRVAKLMEGYGSRVQFSVFRCRLTTKMRAEMLWRLDQIMDDADSLLVIPLCDDCAGTIVERGEIREWPVQKPEHLVL
jgi:CRISPR-associated protein Cas2